MDELPSGQLPDLPLRTFYRCKETPGWLYYQEGDCWFRVPTRGLDRNTTPQQVTPDLTRLTFFPAGAAIDQLFNPVNVAGIKYLADRLDEALSLPELETLLEFVLEARNQRIAETLAVAQALAVDAKSLPSDVVGRWSLHKPSRQAAKAPVSTQPPAQRMLRTIPPDEEGRVILPLDERGFFLGPLFEAHPDGSSWAVKMQEERRVYLKKEPKSANASKKSSEQVVRYAVESVDHTREYSLVVGEAVEFAAEWTDEKGRKQVKRAFYIVVDRTAASLHLEPLEAMSLSDALGAAYRRIRFGKPLAPAAAPAVTKPAPSPLESFVYERQADADERITCLDEGNKSCSTMK